MASVDDSITFAQLPQTQLADLPRAGIVEGNNAGAGRSIYVPAGGDLQAAINSAEPGDEIVLQSGATFIGPFTLPTKSGDAWVTIRSDGPPLVAGERITPEDSAWMAKLIAPGANEPALRTEAGAHHYHIVGLEITAAPSVTEMTSLVNLGDGNAAQDTLAEQPHHFVLDHVYVHGTETLDLRRGVALNSSHTSIIDSNFSEIHSRTSDSQAIAGWNGTGPYLIENNYLEASGENLLFGGGDPYIPNVVPSDITIRGNDFYKPTDWQDVWLVKNLFELKSAARVLVENNTFENNWVDGQDGFAIVLKSTNQDGTAPWSGTVDVTFRHNVIENSPAGINIASRPEHNDAVPAARITIVDNVLNNIGEFAGTSSGRLFQIVGSNGVPLKDIVIENNTAIHNVEIGTTIIFDGAATEGFVFRDNIVTRGEYGIFGGGSSEGKGALSTYAPGGIFTGNVLIGAPAARFGDYAVGNSFPLQVGDVGFVDPAGGNLSLTESSPFFGVGANTYYSNEGAPDGQPPLSRGLESVVVRENSKDVATVDDISNSSGLTYAISGGADAAKFIIDPITGKLAFGIAPDYENPSDTDEDNIYHVTVRANDGAGYLEQRFAIRVANEEEGTLPDEPTNNLQPGEQDGDTPAGFSPTTRSLTQTDIIGETYTSTHKVFDENWTTLLKETRFRADGTVDYEQTMSEDGISVGRQYDQDGEVILVRITNPNGTHELHDYGIEDQTYTETHRMFDANWNKLAETRIRADGSMDYEQRVEPDGATVGRQFDVDGQLTQTLTTHANGSHELHDYGIEGQTYKESHRIYDPNWNKLAETRTRADGSIDFEQRVEADGATVGRQFDLDGKLTQALVTHTNGYHELHDYGIEGQTYTESHRIYNASWDKLAETRLRADGSIDYHVGSDLTIAAPRTVGVNDQPNATTTAPAIWSAIGLTDGHSLFDFSRVENTSGRALPLESLLNLEEWSTNIIGTGHPAAQLVDANDALVEAAETNWWFEPHEQEGGWRI